MPSPANIKGTPRIVAGGIPETLSLLVPARPSLEESKLANDKKSEIQMEFKSLKIANLVVSSSRNPKHYGSKIKIRH